MLTKEEGIIQQVMFEFAGKNASMENTIHKLDFPMVAYEAVNRLEKLVSPIFTEEEHKILKLLLASKIAEIQVNIVYDEPLEQRMGKIKLINILNDIHKKISK
jgi:hypothetical protein